MHGQWSKASTWNWHTHLSWAPSSLHTPPYWQVESSQTLRSLFFSDKSTTQTQTKEEGQRQTMSRQINTYDSSTGKSLLRSPTGSEWRPHGLEIINNDSRQRAEMQETEPSVPPLKEQVATGENTNLGCEGPRRDDCRVVFPWIWTVSFVW